MSADFYRLCVVAGAAGGDPVVMVERGGRMLSLANLMASKPEAAFAKAIDLKPVVEQWAAAEPMIAEVVSEASAKFAVEGRVVDEFTFLPPLALPNKIVCVGVNYRDHIEEMEMPMDQAYPYTFLKPASNTLRGSGARVEIPGNVNMIDWEAELAVVIGAQARDVPASNALSYIAGYSNFNDLSARDKFASRGAVGVDWVSMKAIDGFAPMGPYLVPSRFVEDPQQLPIRLRVNGVAKQESSTSQMVFGVAKIIEHISSVMTLEPGDIVATGTPAGTALGHSPLQWLVAGDEVTVEIGPLGVLRTIMG